MIGFFQSLVLRENPLASSLSYGLLIAVAILCFRFGIFSAVFPPLWITVALILLFSVVLAPFGPKLTGVAVADAFLRGTLAFMLAAIVFQGFLPFLFSLPRIFPKLVLLWFSLTFLIRVQLGGRKLEF